MSYFSINLLFFYARTLAQVGSTYTRGYGLSVAYLESHLVGPDAGPSGESRSCGANLTSRRRYDVPRVSRLLEGEMQLSPVRPDDELSWRVAATRLLAARCRRPQSARLAAPDDAEVGVPAARRWTRRGFCGH